MENNLDLKKKRVLNGESIEFFNDENDVVMIWFSKVSQRFCLELNCKIIKSTKTFKPISDKFDSLGILIENI